MARIPPKLAANLAEEFAHYKEVQRQLLLTIEILFAERDMLRYWLIENAEQKKQKCIKRLPLLRPAKRGP